MPIRIALRIILGILLFLFLGFVLIWGRSLYYSQYHPKYYDQSEATWISQDESIVLFNVRKGEIKENDEQLGVVCAWDNGYSDNLYLKLVAEDLNKIGQSWSFDLHKHNYAECKIKWFFPNWFSIYVVESDFLEAGKTYKFHKQKESVEATTIVVTDNPIATETAIYSRGEFESDILWNSVLEKMREMGYAVEDGTPISTYLYMTNDRERCVEVFHYDSVEKAKNGHKDMISRTRITKGAIIRINTTVFRATQKTAEEIVSLFGLDTLPRLQCVNETVLYESKYALMPDYRAALRDAGYTVIEDRVWSIVSCVSPDADYGFFLVPVHGDITEYLKENADSVIDGIVYIRMEEEGSNLTYLLAAPLEKVSTILEIISEK